VADQIGAKWLTHGLIRHADGSTEEYELGFMERKQAMRKLIAGALQTLAVGPDRQPRRRGRPVPVHRAPRRLREHARRRGCITGIVTADDPAAAADDAAAREENAQSDPEAEAERKINRRLPPLDEDQAQQVMELEREIARWRRVKSKARAITQTGKAASTAYAMEWSRRQRRRRRPRARRSRRSARSPRATCSASPTRTRSRSPTSAPSTRARPTRSTASRTRYSAARALSPETVRLLGPMGAAQMVARVIADRASAVGDPDKLSLDKVRGALGELKQRLEGEIATRSAARARLAMDTAVAMTDEERASAKGESLWTETAARSYRAAKYKEAANTLGMSIAGLQAISSLETALEHPPEKITVGGGDTPAELLGLAQRAKIKLKADQITKTGRGSYSAELPAEALDAPVRLREAPRLRAQERLKAIRTGKGLQRQIEANRSRRGWPTSSARRRRRARCSCSPPSRRTPSATGISPGTPIEKKSEDLRAQMSLGDTLDFAPGRRQDAHRHRRGDAAHARRAAHEPSRARHLPGDRARRVGGHRHEAGLQDRADHGHGDHAPRRRQGRDQGQGRQAFRQAQIDTPADFNIISHEQLAKDPSIAEKLGATIVIADEAQKFKNTGNQRSGALQEIGDRIGVSRGDVMSRTAWQDRFGGTPTGKPGLESATSTSPARTASASSARASSTGTSSTWTPPARATTCPSARPATRTRSTAEDDRGYLHHEVTLDPEHRKHVQQTVQRVNQMQKESKAAGGPGSVRRRADHRQGRPGPARQRASPRRPRGHGRAAAGHDRVGRLPGPPQPTRRRARRQYAKKGVIFNEGVQELGT
jgi:hypothetical protein